ncbi:hypothetical protein Tco_1089270 [Tanacetum coccineum]
MYASRRLVFMEPINRLLYFYTSLFTFSLHRCRFTCFLSLALKHSCLLSIARQLWTSLRTLVKTYRIPLDIYPRLPDPDLSVDHLPNFVRLVKQCSFGSGLALSRSIRSVIRRKYDKSEMSIYDFMTLPTCENAKVIEEPHEFTNSILQHVQNYTTTLAAEGTPIPLPTLEELVAGQPDPKLAKKSKAPMKRKASTSTQAEGVEDVDLSETDYCAFLEGNLEREEGNSSRAASVPNLRLGKRLSSPPRLSHVAFSDPSHVGTSNAANALSSRSVSAGAAGMLGRRSSADNGIP